MSKRTAARGKGKAPAKTSGKVSTAPAKQKPTTWQRDAKKAAPAFDHEVAGLLKQLVVEGAAASAPPPDLPADESGTVMVKGRLTPTERAYLHQHQTEEDKARRARMMARQVERMDEGQAVAVNTTSEQLAQDTAALLEFAVRLRMAAEDEAPLRFGEALTAPATPAAPRGQSVLAGIVQAARLLTEFINVDCAENPLAADEVAAEIKSLRGRSTSWPGLYFMHPAAQNHEQDTHRNIGCDLLFRVNEGKAKPEEPGRATLYVRAAVDLISFVYGHLGLFARAHAGANGEENPLRRWARRNDQKQMFEFVAAMRMAPDDVRDKHIHRMQGVCPGWTCPPALSSSSYWREQFQMTGKPWHRTKENLEKAITRCSKRVAFSKVAPELSGLA